MEDDKRERYLTVVYTDGEKFISPMKFGRSSTVNLPRGKFDESSDADPADQQAVYALFDQTGIRVEFNELESIGVYAAGEDFEMDVYYIKVEALPLKSNLKSNRSFTLVHNPEKRINVIEGYEYVSFSDLDKYSSYSLKGMKNVLWQIDQHFEKGIKWADIA